MCVCVESPPRACMPPWVPARALPCSIRSPQRRHRRKPHSSALQVPRVPRRPRRRRHRLSLRSPPPASAEIRPPAKAFASPAAGPDPTRRARTRRCRVLLRGDGSRQTARCGHRAGLSLRDVGRLEESADGRLTFGLDTRHTEQGCNRSSTIRPAARPVSRRERTAPVEDDRRSASMDARHASAQPQLSDPIPMAEAVATRSLPLE